MLMCVVFLSPCDSSEFLQPVTTSLALFRSPKIRRRKNFSFFFVDFDGVDVWLVLLLASCTVMPRLFHSIFFSRNYFLSYIRNNFIFSKRIDRNAQTHINTTHHTIQFRLADIYIIRYYFFRSFFFFALLQIFPQRLFLLLVFLIRFGRGKFSLSI